MGKLRQLSPELWPLIYLILFSYIELIFRGGVSCLPAALLFSLPEPSCSQGELIVYPCSGVLCHHCCHCQQCFNIISSKTAWPVKAKFYMEPPWEERTKVYINSLGHMTKMAAMPIFGKNFFSRTGSSMILRACHVALGTLALQSLYK